MEQEIICLKCNKPVDPEAAVVVHDMFGTWYFHFYCMEEKKDDTPVHL